MDDANIRILLSTVAEKCRESHAGYETAASEASDNDLRYLFSSYATQRTRFVEELRHVLSDEAADMGSSVAEEREGSDRRSDRILADRAAAEKEMMRLYEEVLRLDLADEQRALLERQWTEIRTAHARICELQELAQPR